MVGDQKFHDDDDDDEHDGDDDDDKRKLNPLGRVCQITFFSMMGGDWSDKQRTANTREVMAQEARQENNH